MLRDDFAVFILTHGRPDRVYTERMLNRGGYTGQLFFVVDDEDPTLDQYLARFGEQVLVFNKEAVAATFDEGTNSPGSRSAIVYARNVCWELARQLGLRWFAQFDDDYTRMSWAIDPQDVYLPPCPHVEDIDAIFEALLTFLESVPWVSTIAIAQGGDFIGGPNASTAGRSLMRKAMNTFVCAVDRPFQFRGMVNEDVNTYTEQARSGLVMFTYPRVRIAQLRTQANPGGMSDLYRATGTYVKSFYTVMYAPSCCQIRTMGVAERRLHHRIDWNATAPLILSEHHRKVPDA